MWQQFFNRKRTFRAWEQDCVCITSLAKNANSSCHGKIYLVSYFKLISSLKSKTSEKENACSRIFCIVLPVRNGNSTSSTKLTANAQKVNSLSLVVRVCEKESPSNQKMAEDQNTPHINIVTSITYHINLANADNTTETFYQIQK